MTLSPELFHALDVVLTFDEGNQAAPYKCSAGYWTIGKGRYIGPNLTDLRLSQAVIDLMLKEDIEKHYAETVELFGEDFLIKEPLARQVALISLVYILGASKLRSQFKQTLPALKQRNWRQAVNLLKATKFARDIDPRQRDGVGRDDRLWHMLIYGTFAAQYKV